MLYNSNKKYLKVFSKQSTGPLRREGVARIVTTGFGALRGPTKTRYLLGAFANMRFSLRSMPGALCLP